MDLKKIATKVHQKECKKDFLNQTPVYFVTEIEECYRKRVLKSNETVIAYGSGKRLKHDKESYKFTLYSPDDISHNLSESPLGVDWGICYTLKLNDTKNGFHFFILDTNLTYVQYILHDFKYFVHSLNPLTFPRIHKIVR